jgi:molecular chaperone DnaK
VAKGAARVPARAASGPARGEPSTGRAASAPATEEPRTDIPSVVNVTSKGYGVMVVRDFDRPRDGKMLFWMIKPNTEVPTRSHDVVRTVYDDQRCMKIHVYESTTDELTNNVEDHVRLIESRLDGLPAGRPKGYEVRVDFELGTDGILRIRARAANGAALQLEARVSGGLAPEDMDAPLPGIRR